MTLLHFLNRGPSADGYPKVSESLNNIAIINVKKFPGKSKSIASEIEKYYERDKHILKRQIEGYEPHIIICGMGEGTTRLFLKDRGLTEDAFGGNSAWSCKKNGFLFIWAYHPSYVQRGGIRLNKYVNEIVTEIKNNWQPNSKAE